LLFVCIVWSNGLVVQHSYDCSLEDTYVGTLGVVLSVNKALLEEKIFSNRQPPPPQLRSSLWLDPELSSQFGGRLSFSLARTAGPSVKSMAGPDVSASPANQSLSRFPHYLAEIIWQDEI
jgi:hypothetical protein